ncbi:MAG: transport system substrate-binding protein [Bryobacterales bacterium]|jgi:NitT/TauT family transport system substrate-binding protein|nr:transport system substrate-binding protein [Bryobacterales bacterium]
MTKPTNFPRRTLLKLLPAAGLLAACGKSSKTRLALNWKPDPEFGGFYAADFAKHGLDVELLPGGSGTPTVQMIGAGSAEFGIIQADELLLARSRGNDVVALFAAFQSCPTGIMAHASRKLESIGDVLRNGTLAMESGLPFARLLEKKFGFDHVKIVPSPGGDLTAFLHDENFAQQCFITAEPLQARRKGVDVKVFPVSDIGYNPYTTVVATSRALLQKNPEMVKNMVAAVREGWAAYLQDPTATNQKMHALNPSMELPSYTEIAQAQKPLIGASPLGKMTAERWDALAAQLKELGDIPKTLPASDCFVDL